MLPHSLSLLQLLFLASFALAANWTATPFVPPAIPLAVKSPYLQTWMLQGTAEGSLNSGWESFRDGTIIAWLGILRVDGQPYVWMGDPQGKNTATQKSMTFTPTRTMITLTCGPVDLTATFLTPIEPTDLVNQSIPFSYLSVEVVANDANTHQVQLYTDVTGEWLISGGTQPQSDQLFQWQATTGTTVNYQFSLQNQTQFLEVGGRARYGSVVYSTTQVSGLTYEVGPDTVLRPGFISSGALNNTVDTQFRAISDMWPVFAFAHDLGVVGSTATTPVVYTIGHVRDPLVQVLNVPNINSLRGSYYLTRYSSTPDLVTALLSDYPNTLARAMNFDENLTTAAFAVTPQDSDYEDVLALSVRQLFGNIEITAGSNGTTHDPTDIMAFMRDGPTNTVDIIYSIWPALLFTNPAIGRYLLEPVLAYQLANPVQGGYAIHDIGASLYPNVTGPSNGSYPVEECGNQLIMALSYTQKTSDNSLITKYQSLYDQFATYLTQNGLYMASQYSADGFNGQLANQTNLAVKSIVALKAASEIFQILGNNDKSQQYNSVATSFLQQWQAIAISSDKSHYTLSYGDNPSWGLLYNLYADLLLGFGMFPQSVYQTQTEWYATKISNYGIQLDSRSTDAETDWQLWTAATVTDQTLRTNMIGLVKKYASSRINNLAFPDRYNSLNGQMSTYYGRTVVGGHFAPLIVSQVQGNSTNSSGGNNNGGKSGNTSGEHPIGSPVLPVAVTMLAALVYAALM
ncbi:hypothetical protein BJ322DRAFT_182136 [Thelephora terrestris]|uniref:Glutaminase n=1 Tax=Thelephora terrestris TaxID=56493 RepID=A0A9P6L503_9AGAM|nr:hypothetical protein BJ322DRAFT_182136 [Thelephora terrestris]